MTDPNGYAVEIAWQRRDLALHDAKDAKLTIEAAIAIEAEAARRVDSVDEIWRRKAVLVDAYLLETA